MLMKVVVVFVIEEFKYDVWRLNIFLLMFVFNILLYDVWNLFYVLLVWYVFIIDLWRMNLGL